MKSTVNFRQVSPAAPNALAMLINQIERALGIGRASPSAGTLATRGYVDEWMRSKVNTSEINKLLREKIVVQLEEGSDFSAMIDQKISAALEPGGSVDTLIDQKITAALEPGGSIDALIDQKIQESSAP